MQELTFPVVMFIRGIHHYDAVEPDETELMTEGTMTIGPREIRCSYEETELTGMEGTTTSFIIRGGCVTLLRSGTVNTQMVFEKGKQYTSLYETPYGEMQVDIQTSKIVYNLSERGGVMEIKYTISMDNIVTGRNCFKIRVRPKR